MMSSRCRKPDRILFLLAVECWSVRGLDLDLDWDLCLLLSVVSSGDFGEECLLFLGMGMWLETRVLLFDRERQRCACS